MAGNVRILNNDDDDVMLRKLNEHLYSTGNNKWILFALILLLIVVATIIVPVILTIHQTYHRRYSNQITAETIPTGTIVLTISTAAEKNQTKNKTQEISSYMDKILKIVGKLIERHDNLAATYVIEEFSNNVTFGRLLSKTEVIGELQRIFSDTKSTSDINMTNAIESFHKIPCSSQISNILFVPDETMYSNQKIHENDMKSAQDLLKQTPVENPINAARIVIGNLEYFQDINDTVSAYSSDMNIDELIEAILPALQVEESMVPENLSTTTISTKEDTTISSNIAETVSTDSWISSTIHEKQISSESLSTTTVSTKEDTMIAPNIGETLSINSWSWNTTDKEQISLEDLSTTTISTNEDITAETLSINSWTWNTTHEEKISSLVDENIESTTISSDLSESIECSSYSSSSEIASLQ